MKRLTLILFVFLNIAMAAAGDFTIRHGARLKVYLPPMDSSLPSTALDMLDADLGKVLGAKLKRATSPKSATLVLSINPSLPREGFHLDVYDGCLYIAGADPHGLAYGILELSRLLGVSPWEYWADSTPLPLSFFSLPDGYSNDQHPAVAYRGIFINDEDWGLNPWATRNEPEAFTLHKDRIKGAIGPKTNERIFQLMLRLRANYYWPAMHECSQPFFTIQGNREMAAKYGIYIGGSHCEPMGTSPAAEWAISGVGEYNYVTNRDNVLNFWRKRVEETQNQEMVYTIGMRGVHDGAMQGVKTKEEKLKYLQMVIDDQRQMLTDVKGVSSDNVPQVFIPYKEVLDIYHSGLKVPDDVTLMWTDDNYGYIRHFPDSSERARSGGNGMYYHVSYWGRPHDYLWLNSLSPSLLESEMCAAYHRGISNVWVLNVGDIKPSEYQIELFMQLAWDGDTYDMLHERQIGVMGGTPVIERIKFIDYFVQREFGDDLQKDIVDVLRTYFRLSSEMKPEHMAGTRVEESDKAYWNTVRPIPGDWTKAQVAQRVKDYQSISDRVESLSRLVPAERRDAFFQLVKYPVQAAAQMNFKFLCPDRCEEACDSIQSLTYIYNKVCAHGKWDGIMDASPRNLPVFQKVTADMLPSYPDVSEWEPLDKGERIVLDGDNPYLLTTPLGTDSVTIKVHLTPNHPYSGNRLSFRLSVDGVQSDEVQYQTYDRSEEWKQNVLRGYAVRILTLPVDASKTQHKVRFLPVQPFKTGVKLLGIYKKNTMIDKINCKW